MKKLIYYCAAFAAIFTTSCARELAPVLSDMQEVTLTAYSECDETKTIVQNDQLVLWQPGDEVELFCGGVGSRFVSQNEEPSGTATFKGMLQGTFNSNEGFSSYEPLLGLFPFNDEASSDGSTIKTVIPSHQSAFANSFDPKAYVTVGKSNDMSMWFYGVCGGICISVSRDDITSVVFKGNNDETIAGEVTIAIPENEPVVQEYGRAINEVTLLPREQGVFKPGVKYYAVMLPATFQNGFSMTFFTAEGKEGTYVSAKSNSVKRAIFATIENADSYISEWKETQQSPYADLSSGVYLGITAFNQELLSSPIQRLTSTAVDNCNSFIDNLSTKNGTLLYCAAEKSLDDLHKAVLPGDLGGVVMVTFTDGLDQGSIMINTDYESDEEYLSAVNGRITSETVLNKPIKAYAVGVKGNDVSDMNMFRSNLKKLSNPESNYSELSSISSLDSKLKEIAKLISDVGGSSKLKLTIPGQANGTRIRFTFDNVTNADNSKMYIEGTFNLKERSLNDIEYCGLTSESGTKVQGTVNGIFVTFCFESVNVEGGTAIKKENIQQWNYVSSTSSWQVNSEFDNSESDITKQSLAVMLNLDCSKSLGTNISYMQTAAKNFVKALYDASIVPGKVNGVRFNDNNKSNVAVGYTIHLNTIIEPSTAPNTNLIWTSSDKSIATVDPDGNVLGVADGTAIITVKTVFGGFSSTCEITVIDPSLSKYYVDLGLSVKWASFNLGASIPEEFGRYFAWGDVVGQTWDGVSWSGGGFNSNTSYELDDDDNLMPEYDAAHVILGGKCRMPTVGEMRELRDNCTSTWTIINGFSGSLFTSKKNGKSIFLPATGRQDNKYGLIYEGREGHYWSSTIYTSYAALPLNISPDTIDTYNWGNSAGFSIRPVSE